VGFHIDSYKLEIEVNRQKNVSVCPVAPRKS